MVTKAEQEARKLVDDWAHDFRIPLDPQDDDYWALVRQFAPEIEKRDALVAACQLLLKSSGGSHHWQGGTGEGLKAIEDALRALKVHVSCGECAEFRKTVNS